MNARVTKLLKHQLEVPSEELSEPVPIVGFDGKPGHVVSKLWTPNLLIDSRREKKCPMLELDLGKHDVILGLNGWRNTT